jgi:hypothetical protein
MEGRREAALPLDIQWMGYKDGTRGKAMRVTGCARFMAVGNALQSRCYYYYAKDLDIPLPSPSPRLPVLSRRSAVPGGVVVPVDTAGDFHAEDRHGVAGVGGAGDRVIA